MSRFIAGILVVSALIPACGQAGIRDWMGKKSSDTAPEVTSSNAVKRLHLTLSDKAGEKELLQGISAKRILRQEKQVLLLLLDEKRRDLVNLDGELAKTFGIKPDHNYQYDAKAMAISELPAATTATATNTPVAAATRVKTLKSADEARLFASLAAAKQKTQEDLTVLARLSQEKEEALGRVDKILKEKFSMSRDRNYFYEGKTMRLYEVIAPSSKGVVQ